MLRNDQLRKSLPAKVTAIGFIGLILLAQFHLVFVITKREGPEWIAYGMQGALILVFLGGIGMLWLRFKGGSDASIDDSEGDQSR